MGDVTAIQWTDHTFNPWIGCHKVDPACKHCYAAESTPARVSGAKGLPLWGPDAHRQVTSAANWQLPERWDRNAKRAGVRQRVFCASLADVFEGRDDLDPHRARLFHLIERTPHLDWQLLTKRPENVMRMVPWTWIEQFPPNVWMGTTAGDQAGADARIQMLLQCPAAVRFVSTEPLLGPVSFGIHLGGVRLVGGKRWSGNLPLLDWVIVGGESGPNARPCHVEWIRSIVRQCREADTPCFVKQLGAHYVDEINGVGGAQCRPDPAIVPPIARLIHPKGGDMDEWPEELRVRQFPTTGGSL